MIQLKNGERAAYDWDQRGSTSIWLANGEIGLAAQRKGKWLNFVFAQRPNKTIGYRSGDFSASTAPPELAYALTVHKAQGSEFSIVFFVLPARTRLFSRELVYTALTRPRSKLVLLIEGDSADRIFDLSKPGRSETIRRSTNLFLPV